jgi:hypothetical protein
VLGNAASAVGKKVKDVLFGTAFRRQIVDIVKKTLSIGVPGERCNLR